MKATITLTSELYGEEHFRYETVKEADKGFNRLMKACNKQFEIDKVDRELSLEGANGKIFRSARVGGEEV